MEDYLLVLKFIMLLILVALLAYFAIRFGLRRLQPGLGQSYIKVLQKVPLDMKGDSLLVLVHIGERVLLLGSARGRITMLQEFSPEALALSPEDPGRAEKETGFSKLLAGYREKIRSGKEGTGV